MFALETGRITEFKRLKRSLRDYPLYPYLEYFEARAHIAGITPAQAQAIRDSMADLHLGKRFYNRWLIIQARGNHWERYLRYYQPTDNAEARCYYLRALYRSGQKSAALDQVADLWVVGKSQPRACDSLFEVWINAGRLTEDLAWERLHLAIQANERALGRYLLKFFSGSQATAARAYYDGHVRPSVVKSSSRFADTEHGRIALNHGLIRYGNRDAEAAAAAWRSHRDRYGFTEEQKILLDHQMILALAREGTMPTVEPNTFAAALIEGVAAAAVANERWVTAQEWIASLPQPARSELRWRYWLARSKLASGIDVEDSHVLLEELAGHRHYYGFLAADLLGIEPALNGDAPASSAATRMRLRGHPGVRRITELYAVGDLVNARREWNAVLPGLSIDQRATLIELAIEIGWVDQAILGAGRAQLVDLLHARFPTPFMGMFRRHAFETNMPVSFLYAISRQESAFNPLAISRSGARGVMQLMPATARRTAARARLKRPSNSDLLDPTINIRIGAHHVAGLMDRYDNHRAIVAAAYNAGSARVNRWLADIGTMPTDVWIERIPYSETRNYVKNVLAFSYVYGTRLDNRVPVLGANEHEVP